MITVRPAGSGDADAVWKILEPTIRAGETYTLPRDMPPDQSLAYWFATGNEVFVAEENGEVIGTYFLHANQKGGGAHVANCGYMTSVRASGRGVARAMCRHSLDHKRLADSLPCSSTLWSAPTSAPFAFGKASVSKLSDAFREPSCIPPPVT